MYLSCSCCWNGTLRVSEAHCSEVDSQTAYPLIPQHKKTLFCCPKSTEVKDTFSVFSNTPQTSHHHPRWVQLFQFQAVKGKYINFSLFLSFHFLTFKTKFWELQSVFQVSGTEHPSTVTWSVDHSDGHCEGLWYDTYI